MNMDFEPVNTRLLFSKQDANDPRLGEFVKPGTLADVQADSIVVAGYPDDDGIALNGGRVGSRQAPDQIRKFLYKTTVPKILKPIIDFGNLQTLTPLEDRHTLAKRNIEGALKKGARVLTFGGGHDYGYPDSAAFVDAFKDKNPLVINFDAHYDVRNLNKGITSGTPFFRLLEKHNGFQFLSIGTQDLCNSKFHRDYLDQKQGVRIERDHQLQSGANLFSFTQEKASSLLTPHRPTWISLDIDVFSSNFAPGCSQSWPFGIFPLEFIPLYFYLLKTLDVRGLGIYEVSPPLDVNDQTSKLAAQIASRFLLGVPS